jgi:hypothetical protein
MVILSLGRRTQLLKRSGEAIVLHFYFKEADNSANDKTGEQGNLGCSRRSEKMFRKVRLSRLYGKGELKGESCRRREQRTLLDPKLFLSAVERADR